MERPRIKIERKPLDWCIEAIGLLLVLSHWSVILLFYFRLPNIIPVHYNGAGVIDDWGDKSTLWMLPVISTAMYIGITFLQKIPHFYNYATIEITEQNAEKIYRCGVRMIAIFKVLLVAVFTFLTVQVLQDAFHTFWFVRFWMIMAGIGLAIITMIYYIVKMYMVR